MNISHLRSILEEKATSLELASGTQECSSLTTLESCHSDCAFFVKSKKYLDQLLKLLNDRPESLKSLVAIFSQKLWDKLESGERSVIEMALSGVWVSDKIDLCMCVLSKAFYYQESENDNDIVDGRQMGTANVHPSAMIGQGAFIGAHVKVGENVIIHSGARIMSHSSLGEGTVVFPNAIIYPRVSIGANCRVHSNVTIGADGFGYHFDSGIHHKIWHFGGVEISDDVEVGANSCIDGGTFAPTIVGAGTKIDNHVQVGHNCQIGRGVIICGHVAIGGSTRIGDFVVFGGKSGTGHGLSIAAQSEVGGGALVNCDWDEKVQLGGHPARPLKEWLRGLAYIRRESLKK